MDDKKRTARYWIAFFILAVFLVILFVWNVNAGSIHLSVGEILNIIFRHQGDATAYNIIWEIRLPRILSVIILGGALSVSGFLLQTFFNNPIAGPFVLGISSGAKLVVAMIMAAEPMEIDLLRKKIISRATTELGTMIEDIHTILTTDDDSLDELTYMHKLK